MTSGRTGPSPASLLVREATPDDRLGVRRVLDAAMLAVREDLPERIESGEVLVASEAESILGALVLVPLDRGARVDSVAVRRAQRGRGVGSALVRTALEREDRLVAEFDPSVRPFYESLDFEISPAEVGEDKRLWGVCDTRNTRDAE